MVRSYIATKREQDRLSTFMVTGEIDKYVRTTIYRIIRNLPKLNQEMEFLEKVVGRYKSKVKPTKQEKE